MALPVNVSTHLIPAYYSIYRPRKDERLSWPSWLTYSGWLTHISGHPSAAGWAQDRESSPARDRRSTTVPRHQLAVAELLVILAGISYLRRTRAMRCFARRAVRRRGRSLWQTVWPRSSVSPEFRKKFQGKEPLFWRYMNFLIKQRRIGGRKALRQLDLFSRFDKTPACDRQTDRQTQSHS